MCWNLREAKHTSAEVGLPLNSSTEGAVKGFLGNAGQCCNESSDVVAADSFVPPEVATGATYMVQDHTYNSLIEREDLSSQDSVSAICLRKQDGSAEALAQIKSIESEEGSLVGGDVARHNDRSEKVNSVGHRARLVGTEVEHNRLQGHSTLRSEATDAFPIASRVAEGTQSVCWLDCKTEKAFG